MGTENENTPTAGVVIFRGTIRAEHDSKMSTMIDVKEYDKIMALYRYRAEQSLNTSNI